MTTPLTDLLLTLSVRDGEGRLRAMLSHGTAGECLADDEFLPSAADQAQSLLGILSGFPETDVPNTALVELGQALAEMALPPKVRVALRFALAGTASVAPIRLRIGSAREDLAGLPWEFLHLGGTRNPTFPAFSACTHACDWCGSRRPAHR